MPIFLLSISGVLSLHSPVVSQAPHHFSSSEIGFAFTCSVSSSLKDKSKVRDDF